MSYCRWSSDNYRSDVYSYECNSGAFVTHVAAKRVVNVELLPQIDTTSIDRAIETSIAQNKALDAAERKPIGLQYDGVTFRNYSRQELLDTLTMLKSAGYNVPQSALDEVQDEIDEMNETDKE